MAYKNPLRLAKYGCFFVSDATTLTSYNLYTYLFVHFNRGREAHGADISILPELQNWAVHDCWATYFNYFDCKHSVCGAHLLRELTVLIENGGIFIYHVQTH